MNTAEATVDEIEFENFNQMDRGGQAFFQRSRVWMLLKRRRLKKGYSVAVGLAVSLVATLNVTKPKKNHQLLFFDLAPVASLVTNDSA
ncbi:hypothetical protein ACFX1R_011533 [Malus domestica]